MLKKHTHKYAAVLVKYNVAPLISKQTLQLDKRKKPQQTMTDVNKCHGGGVNYAVHITLHTHTHARLMALFPGLPR